MVRRLLLCLIVSTTAMAQMPPALQQRVAQLHAQGALKEIRKVSYKPGNICAGLIGFNLANKKVAFVALQYGGTQWTPFKAVPFDQQNDSFGVVSDGEKVVVLQSNSKINHENTVGFHVELDPVSKTVVLRPVELGSFSRAPNDELEEWLTF
jgi:hypothetical protein